MTNTNPEPIAARGQDDLMLIRAVLRGYPSSFARADALQAVERLSSHQAAPAEGGQAVTDEQIKGVAQRFVISQLSPHGGYKAIADHVGFARAVLALAQPAPEAAPTKWKEPVSQDLLTQIQVAAVAAPAPAASEGAPKAVTYLRRHIDNAAEALSEVYGFVKMDEALTLKVGRALSSLRAMQSIDTQSTPESAPTINGEPPTAHSLLAALIDIYDDAWLPPEDRSYAGEAWPDIITAARAFLAEPAPASEAVAEWQYRCRPNWRGASGWSDWQKCSEGVAQDYMKTPTLHDWSYEVRALYAQPTGGESVDAVRELPEELSKRVMHEIGHAINMAGPDHPERWARAAWRVIRRHLTERAALKAAPPQAG